MTHAVRDFHSPPYFLDHSPFHSEKEAWGSLARLYAFAARLYEIVEDEAFTRDIHAVAEGTDDRMTLPFPYSGILQVQSTTDRAAIEDDPIAAAVDAARAIRARFIESLPPHAVRLWPTNRFVIAGGPGKTDDGIVMLVRWLDARTPEIGGK